MELILTQTVKNLGSAGDQVKVARGYAENYLIPKKLAVRATEADRKYWEKQRQAIAEKEAAKRAQAQAIADKLSKAKVTIKKKAGVEDKLFGSVTAKEIAAALKEQSGVEIDKKNLILPDSIKKIGGYTIKTSLHPEVEGEFTVEIMPEDT
jgi:large subunit ribosomal protein L9